MKSIVLFFVLLISCTTTVPPISAEQKAEVVKRILNDTIISRDFPLFNQTIHFQRHHFLHKELDITREDSLKIIEQISESTTISVSSNAYNLIDSLYIQSKVNDLKNENYHESGFIFTSISNPVFIKNNEIALIQVKLNCYGLLCGQLKTILLSKSKGKWNIVSVKYGHIKH